MSQYNLTSLSRSLSDIPAKTRTVAKSPLYSKMEKMGIGEAFVVEKAEMASVAANIYATAKRIGIKVTLRQLPEGVGVWRIRNSNARTEVEQTKETSATRKSRIGKKTLVKGNQKGRKVA